MNDNNGQKFRQMYFDMEGNVRQETYVFHKEMTEEKKEEYERIVADSNQMTIYDFLKPEL